MGQPDNRQLRICFFHKVSLPFNYHTIGGGAERIILQLAQYMSRSGHRVSIVNTLPKDYYDKEVGVRFLSSQKTLIAHISNYARIPMLSDRSHVLGGLFRLLSSKLDVLHATTSEVFAWKSLFNIKSRVNVLHFHDDPKVLLYHRKILNVKIHPILLGILENVGVCIAPSRYIAKEILRTGLIRGGQVRVIPNGIDVKKLTEFPEQRSKNRILFVGAIVPRKGTHVAIKAMKMVRKAIPNSELLIAGSPILWGRSSSDPYMKHVLHEAKDLNCVRFLGLVNEEQKIKLYRSASVCVVPSIYGDPFNLVVLEAQASGLPVIASEIGGIPELIDNNITGILVKPGDVFELGETIIRLLTNERVRKTISSNAQLHAKRYDWSHVGNQFLEVYLSWI